MNRSIQMAVFVTIVEAGSFVSAAETLRMSKAAVSRHMNALEARLGVRLLQRTTRRLSLTEEGQIFFQRAKDILGAMDEAESILSHHAHEASGRIRINVPLSFGITHLAPLWAGFLRQYPRVSLEISLNDRVVDLVEEGYDMAVRISILPSSSLICRRLASTRMVLCASPGYLAQHGAPESPQDLQRHTVMSYTLLNNQEEWRYQGPDGPARLRVHPSILSNNGDTCRMIALQDGGIILQPSFIVSEDIRQGTLVELLPQCRFDELGVYAVYPSRRQLSLKVRAMIDYLSDAMQKDY